jgi:hypothetical protein
MTDRDTIFQAFDSGLDWLSIKPVAVSERALPWFWNWADWQYAARWDSERLPFVQGPNMLFTNSASPRIDAHGRVLTWLTTTTVHWLSRRLCSRVARLFVWGLGGETRPATRFGLRFVRSQAVSDSSLPN